MSLKYSGERCFKKVLQDAGVESDGYTVVCSQEDQSKVLTGRNYVVRFVSGRQMTPKSRVIEARFELLTRSTADKQQGEGDEAPGLRHQSAVDRLNVALMNNAAGLLVLLNAAAAALGVAFGVQFVRGLGELEVRKREGERVMLDGTGFEARVCEVLIS